MAMAGVGSSPDNIFRVSAALPQSNQRSVNGAVAMTTIRATNQPTRADSMNATTSASSNRTTRALIL
jgi:hypothetical protein